MPIYISLGFKHTKKTLTQFSTEETSVAQNNKTPELLRVSKNDKAQ